MSEIKHPAHLEEEKNPIDQLQHLWDRWGKQASYALVVIVLVVGTAILPYKNLVSGPGKRKPRKRCSARRSITAWTPARLAPQR